MDERRAQFERIMQGVMQTLTDEGKLIEAGWIGLRIAAIDPDAPEDQITEMRMAFMAGAQHLFASIMGILDPGEEPTDDDLRRMDLIANELERFGQELAAKHYPTKGNG